MPKIAALKKTPPTKATSKKVTPKVIKKAGKKDSASSTPKVLSRKVSVELKKSNSLKS